LRNVKSTNFFYPIMSTQMMWSLFIDTLNIYFINFFYSLINKLYTLIPIFLVKQLIPLTFLFGFYLVRHLLLNETSVSTKSSHYENPLKEKKEKRKKEEEAVESLLLLLLLLLFLIIIIKKKQVVLKKSSSRFAHKKSWIKITGHWFNCPLLR